ncbi:MAG: hypothetical protein Ct9H300mP2_0110 [Candidatus Neomarinimicrobiota bacterium]|nr:MAG: hypothetical protein Ct9H300mP2_0110 [Candidatus Neomarinimicrobiota bacterium]
MSLMDKVQQDMYIAMKSGDQIKTSTLRTLLSKLKDKKIEMKAISLIQIL